MTTTIAPRRPVFWRRLASVTAATLLLGAGLFVVDAGAAHRPLTASPKDGNRAVRDGQQVFVDGHGPVGAVAGARILGLRADGSLVGAQVVGESALNASPERDGGFVRNDDGEVTGRLGLGCMFGAADGPGARFCPLPVGETWSAQVEITLDTGAVLTSTPVPVDVTFPVIRRYEVVAPGVIRVLFSEPVRHEQGDSQTDWTVTEPDAVVAEVVNPAGDDCEPEPGDDRRLGVDDCARLLHVVGLPEDAEPHVEYAAGINRLGATYEDFTDNGLDRSDATGSGARSDAVDLVRPAAPEITRIADESVPPDSPTVIGRQSDPVVELSGLTAGHDAQVVVTAPSGSVSESGWMTAGDDGTASVTLAGLAEQGPHRLAAVARDPNGNLSTESDKEPARTDGTPSTATYVLDTVAPLVLGALAEPQGLTVTLSEDVTGANDPSDWSVQSAGGPKNVTGVSGSGDRRLLTVEGGAVPGDELAYAPGSDGRYADEAGNVLADSVVIVSGLPAPVVLDPEAELFTRELSASVSGTARPHASVEVFRDADRDGVPDGDGATLGTALVDANGAWTADVPLVRDAGNDLLVQARDDAQAQRSPLAGVPRIVQDSTAPALEVLAPRGTDVLPGGAPADVRWSTGDANHGDARMRVELTVDGTAFTVVSPAAVAADGRTSVVLPKVDTSVAQVRLTTNDLAGNETQRLSEQFTIDATTPAFTARTIAPREVEVTFTEPVSGPLGPDWRVAGQPATVASADRTGRSPFEADRAQVLVLTTSADFDPDAKPQVEYQPSRTAATGELVDRAGQGVAADDRSETADDRIRPAVPTIETVEGRPLDDDGRVLGAADRPVLRVSGLRKGYTAVVERATESGTPAEGSATTAEGDTADVQSPLLPADGPHALRVVVTDTNGNRSVNDDLRPGAPDGGPSEVTYVLDSLVPVLLSADSEDGDVVVDLSEAVTGDDDPDHWTLRTPSGEVRDVTAVQGSGDSRVLTVEGGGPAGSELRYAPGSTGRYTDAAGNSVADTSLVVGGVPAPLVLSPRTELVTRQESVVIDGSAQGATVVDVFRDGNRDGSPDGAAVTSVPVGDRGAWQASVALDKDERNDLLVRARDEVTGNESPVVAVPPIVQDSRAPELELLEPTGTEVLAGGASEMVRWSSTDENHAPDGIRVELTVDGTNYQVLAAAAAPGDAEGSLEYTVPDVDTTVARVRVTAADLAGNRTVRLSGPFTIDAVTPFFAARTVAERTVRVVFNEDVSGTLMPTDFQVAGAPATVQRADGPSVQASGSRVFTLTTVSSIGPNETPLVRYAPTAAGQLVDRAGQPVADDDRLVLAVDGIVPAAPTVTEPAGTVYEAGPRRAFAGQSETGTSVVLVREDGSRASEPVRTQADGTWRAVGELRPNDRNVLRALATDDAGNTSAPTAAPGVVQDSLNPSVTIDAPKAGERLPLDTDVEVRWRSSDANLAPKPAVVDVTTDGGQTWRLLGEDQPASGTLTWRTPSEPTSKAAVRVRALDLAGRTGTAVEGFIGVGTAADPGTFTPPDKPLQPLPGQVRDAVSERGPLGRALGALPRTGIELVRLVLFGIVTLLTGAGIVVAGRNQRRRPT